MGTVTTRRPSVNPAAEEVCNGIDDDCDTLTDEDGNGEDSDGDTVANLCDNCPATANTVIRATRTRTCNRRRVRQLRFHLAIPIKRISTSTT